MENNGHPTRRRKPLRATTSRSAIPPRAATMRRLATPAQAWAPPQVVDDVACKAEHLTDPAPSPQESARDQTEAFDAKDTDFAQALLKSSAVQVAAPTRSKRTSTASIPRTRTSSDHRTGSAATARQLNDSSTKNEGKGWPKHKIAAVCAALLALMISAAWIALS